MIKHRPALLPLCLMLMVMLFLSACGTESAGNTPASAATPAATASPVPSPTAGTGGTRTYTDALSREVEIPEHPQRIAAHYFAPEIGKNRTDRGHELQRGILLPGCASLASLQVWRMRPSSGLTPTMLKWSKSVKS
ncbi:MULTISPECIES: hypothetical protein [unclassified Paenibacillus]|uniref:hypothetical protein n=1 Tax=unclassified Paenibacillus TaxID=185978 RepID=UPI00240647ED|nr:MULTISPECIES: hypothetical protein [unclassified Paenibacillus]